MTLSPLTCAVRGCNHREHRDAKNAYDNNRKRQIAYGRWNPLVDAEPIRQHVRWLMEQGVPLKNLTPIYPTVHALVYGRPSRGVKPVQRMKKHIAEALLAVQPTLDMLGPGAHVDATGVRRRLQALHALGWGWAALARELESVPIQVRSTLTADTVTAKWARRVIAAYDRLSMVRPEGKYAQRARNRSARRGWLPPLAWDDEFLDLPDADLAAELSRRTAAMDSAELHRCYRASLEGDRSPLIVAAAEEYLARRRAARTKTTAA